MMTDTPLMGNRPPLTPQQSTETSDDDVPGWPTIAKLMAVRPEFESYSRFRELNVKNLLYYQVELAELREELKELELIDWQKRELSDAGKFAKRADYLIASPTLESSKDRKQWKVVVKIRKLLKQYNAALLQHEKMSALPEPDSCNIEELRKWIKRPEYGNYCIGGHGSDAWGDLYSKEKLPDPLMQRIWLLLRSIFWPPKAPPNTLDLVSTRPLRNIDGLTRWVQQKWIPFYHECRTSPSQTNTSDPSAIEENRQGRGKDGNPLFDLECYSGRTMLRFTSYVATVVACILPTLAIGVLATAHGTTHILLYIGGFTALFAIGLIVLTNPDTTRVEIFTATAAFSAVLVVFVQNQ